MIFITDPLFYAVAAPAVLLIGVSKGGISGIGVLAMPLMAIFVPPLQAAAVLLPVLCLMDLMSLVAYWGKWHVRSVVVLTCSAMVGITLGTLTFSYFNPAAIRLIIGLIAIGFVIYFVLGQRAIGTRAGLIKGTFWGAVAGFTSFSAHAGGPPANIYLLPQRLHRTTFQATAVAFFASVNYAKLVPYSYLGQLNTENLGTSLLLVPLAPVGVWLGLKLHKNLANDGFYRIIYLFLSIAGVKLIFDGLT